MPTQARIDLLQAVRCADHEEGWFAEGETVVVGVSGGGDSVVLLTVLARYAPERGLRLHVAHLDHGLRAGSGADAAFVDGLACRLGLPATVEARAVASLSAGLGRGLEHAARVVRYRFLAEVAASLGAPVVAVGHTADDVAETVLMRLIRGSGPAGLGVMPAVAALPEAAAGIARARLVRPLVRAWRADVRAFAAAEGLDWREDPSNLDPRYLRNRVRERLLPILAAENPRLREALVRLARAAADEAEWMDDLVAREWSGVETSVEDGPATAAGDPTAPGERDEVALRLSAWRDCRPALRRRLLRVAWARAAGDGGDLEWSHVRAVIDLARRGRNGSRVHLPRGLEAVCLGDRLVLRRRADGGPLGGAAGPAVGRPVDRGVTPPAGGGPAGCEERPDDGFVLAPSALLRWAGGWELEARECPPPAAPTAGSSDTSSAGLVGGATAGAAAVSRAASSAQPSPALADGSTTGSSAESNERPGAAPMDGPWTTLVDADRLQLVEGALRVRARCPGDRMAPAGMGGRHRSLQDVFVDGRVPREQRDCWPVVLDGEGIVWLPGYRVDERVRAGPSCGRVWRLIARPPEGWRPIGAGAGGPRPASREPRSG